MDTEPKTGTKNKESIIKGISLYIFSICIIILLIFLLIGNHYRARHSFYSKYDMYGRNRTSVFETIFQSLEEAYINVKDHIYGTYDKYIDLSEKVLSSPLRSYRETKLAEFCRNTGFKGMINNNTGQAGVSSKRAFDIMLGTFNLPEPKDTATFRSNADFLIQNIITIYGGEKAGIKLKRNSVYEETDVNNRIHVTGFYAYYIQMADHQHTYFWDRSEKSTSSTGFSLSPEKCALVISYNLKDKNYQIKNTLFEMPLSIPKDKIGKESALKKATARMLKRKRIKQTDFKNLNIKVAKYYYIRYPESESQYDCSIQSAWFIKFQGGLYEGKRKSITPFDDYINSEYMVDAFTGKVGWTDIPYSSLPDVEDPDW